MFVGINLTSTKIKAKDMNSLEQGPNQIHTVQYTVLGSNSLRKETDTQEPHKSSGWVHKREGRLKKKMN